MDAKSSNEFDPALVGRSYTSDEAIGQLNVLQSSPNTLFEEL